MIRIAVLPGDGIGPEITRVAVEVLLQAARREELSLELEEGLVGGAAIDAAGDPLPAETLHLCEQSAAILFGAVGGPKWDQGERRPEAGLLGLRKHFDLFANLRPAVLYPALTSSSPLASDRVEGGFDVMILRELTGGLYFGEPRYDRGDEAINSMPYTTREVERIARRAFELARLRRRKVTSVDKANVLEVSRLWRRTVEAVAREYPDVELDHLYVDNAAMQLILRPKSFDVMVTENLFGDILSDEAAVLTGSIGLLASASLGSGTFGMYEPIHGSAPDIAGKGIANPLAMVLSVAMMLRYSLGSPQAADRIEQAVAAVLADGLRTADLARPGEAAIGTDQMGEALLARI